MAAVIALLGQVLGILSSTFGIVSNVLGIVGTAAQETAKYAIQKTAAAAANTVNSPTFGNAALLTAIQNVEDEVVACTAALALQIINLTDGTTPVSLPVSPPSGYGPTDVSGVASDVWHYDMPGRGYPVFNYLYEAGKWAAFSGNLRWLGDENKYFEAVYGGVDYVPGAADWVPAFDPTDILVTEDVKDCLTRQNPGWAVDWAFAPQGHVRLTFPGSAEIQEWQSTIDGSDFAIIKSRIFPVVTSRFAPVWPGAANVTFGMPVAITSALSITADMHGVIVTLTSVPPGKPIYVLGDQTATAHIGQIAFLSDNGDMEYPQNLSFASEVYVPLAMFQASGVKMRAVPGVTGTITPWTTNA